jgi:hypothetical protein
MYVPFGQAFLHRFKQVILPGESDRFSFQANPRPDHADPVTIIQRGRKKQRVHAAFAIIMSRLQQ